MRSAIQVYKLINKATCFEYDETHLTTIIIINKININHVKNRNKNVRNIN